jgi:hypothetical protein
MSAKFIVAVPFIIERDGAILMLRRSPTKDHAPGEWEFGSGRVDIVGPVSTFHFYRGASRGGGRHHLLVPLSRWRAGAIGGA